MKIQIIDIETAPLPNAADLINALYPFDPDKVALGNRTKKETIDAYIEECRQNHVPSILEKAQLDPALSYVCAIGRMDTETLVHDIRVIDSPDHEFILVDSVMTQLANQYSSPERFAGWNLCGFDLEFLFRRCWIRNLNPAWRIRRGRYWNTDVVIDLMQEWAFYNSRNQWCSLDKAARILGVRDPDRPDEVSGKEFWKYLTSDREKAFAYLRAYLRETAMIANRILPY